MSEIYAEWNKFGSAWFPQFINGEFFSYPSLPNTRSIPVGFLKRREARKWMKANCGKLKYKLVKLTEEEILFRWYYFVKILKNISSDYDITQDPVL